MKLTAMLSLSFFGFCAFAQNGPNENPKALDEKEVYEEKVESNPFLITVHRANYLLPYSHNSRITNTFTTDALSDSQEVDNTELKFQLSFKLPIFKSQFSKNTKLYFAYSQLTFWQAYQHDPFIRETNYEPELFVSHLINDNSKISLAINHQSNGRGGFYERSWNRIYLDYQLQFNTFFINVQPWLLVFKGDSSNIHNPDITHYLGHEQITIGFNLDRISASILLTNIESGFQRGKREVQLAYKLKHHWYLFAQVFSGYGQSLIEYNHKNTGVGVGLAMNV